MDLFLLVIPFHFSVLALDASPILKLPKVTEWLDFAMQPGGTRYEYLNICATRNSHRCLRFLRETGRVRREDFTFTGRKSTAFPLAIAASNVRCFCMSLGFLISHFISFSSSFSCSKTPR